MLAHFREDWERIVAGHSRMTMSEALAHYLTLPHETLKGHDVKSRGEKLIADVLFEHGVEYHYERNFYWKDDNYRPDFTIPREPRSDLIIEYFGLEGNADYDERSEQKRRFWAKRG